MAIDNLGSFLERLDDEGELVRIREPLRAKLEIAEVSDRVMKQPGGGKALLFERPLLDDGSPSEFPVAINLFGSWRRMALALGVDELTEHADRIAELMQPDVPTGFWAKVQMLPKFAELAKVPPRPYRGTPPCQQVVLEGDDVDLARLPVLTSWPKDAGPFITMPMVLTRDPDTGVQNVGMYRIQVTGPRTAFMHWQRHKGGAAHFRRWKERGETRMPVAVALGADPATMYTPTAPLPPGIDEYLFSGFLRRAPLQVATTADSDLRIPAEAEIVLEGYVDTTEPLGLEGPFGDHTGFYTPADWFPVFHIERVTRRREAVYPATIVGRPPMEDFYMGGATERIFLPLLRMTMPEIVDYHMPAEGIFHNLVFVSIRQGVSRARVQGDERSLGAGPDEPGQGHRGRGPRDRREEHGRRLVVCAQQHRPRARHPVHARPGRRPRPLGARSRLRLEDGDRRHAQAARGRLRRATGPK